MGWKELELFPNWEFSKDGEARQKIKTYEDRNGYIFLLLKDKNSVKRNIPLHRLIATAFIPNPENKPHINHKDGNKRNNSVENLEWCTHQENMKHYSEKLMPKRIKLSAEQILSLKSQGFTHEEIGQKMGLSQKTIYNHLKTYENLSNNIM